VDIITSTLFNASAYKTYGAIIAEERYEPAGFPVAMGLKDIRLALAAGETAAVPMPMASIIRDHFLEAEAQGGSNATGHRLREFVRGTRGCNRSSRGVSTATTKNPRSTIEVLTPLPASANA
jgi:3-hydroxyisobutyrate dehydrogenase-like beta-hydroxyacid dehydrogenase